MTTDLESRISTFIRPEISSLQAYSVPERSDLIKLDAMESPYGLSTEIHQQWLERMATIPLNRYPGDAYAKLVMQLRNLHELTSDQGVLFGNGSDELIQIALQASSGGCVLTPMPGFSMYQVLPCCTGNRLITVSLAQDFSLDLERMLKAIKEHQPGMVLLSIPNNPTGNIFCPDAVEQIIRMAPGFVMIDEAYSAFSANSWLESLANHPHLLISRTYSKSGLAGLRFGYLLAHRQLIETLNKVRLPYNINSLTATSMSFLVDHQDFFATQVAKIIEQRDWLADALSRLDALTVYPSVANFLLMRIQGNSSREIHRQLGQRGILIKNMDGSHPLLANCLRISVGTASENQRLLETLTDLLAQ